MARKIPKDNLEILPVFFDRMRTLIKDEDIVPLLDRFIVEDKLYNFINILFYLDSIEDDIDKMKNEFIYFYDWLKHHAKLDEFDSFENLYKTYKETYVPQDFDIFIAMEFRDNDDILSAIKGVIEKVNSDTGLKLNPLRIDELKKGNTYQIMEEILNKIQQNRLLIADITNMNPNVYLEVGFAMGLAKAKSIENQIMLFVKDEGRDTKVGFDLSSYHQNRYQNTEDLRKKLEKRLGQFYKNYIDAETYERIGYENS